MVITVCISLAGSLAAFGLSRNARVTLLAVDDNGQPIAGAKVGVGFEGPGGKYTGKNGFTDENGLFTASGESLGDIQYGAEKEGYYPSHYHYSFKSMGAFRWEPWNSILKVLLRKIENPVPMYARNSMTAQKKIKIPVIGKDVGFDLLMYDFVPPYGSGKFADFIFKLDKKFVDFNNYEANLLLKFSSDMDGIQFIEENLTDGSRFKLHRFAPENGYKQTIEIIRRKISGGESYINYNYNDNYIFRIRSEVKDGKLERAMHGKIRGPIQLDPRREPTEIYFTYYLNPDYTRNLEFDPKRNLFGNLSDLEQVREP
jgi:hypothetical protein